MDIKEKYYAKNIQIFNLKQIILRPVLEYQNYYTSVNFKSWRHKKIISVLANTASVFILFEYTFYIE